MLARGALPFLLFVGLLLPVLILQRLPTARADEAADRRALVEKLLASGSDAERDALLDQNRSRLSVDLVGELCQAVHSLQVSGAGGTRIRQALATAAAVARRVGKGEGEAHVLLC